MSEQGAGPSEGLNDRMTDVIEELYQVAGYASITWMLPDGSMVSMSHSAGGEVESDTELAQ